MISIDESKLRKQPWDFTQDEIRVGELSEDTGHKCVVCESPIMRLYSTEIDKQTGDIISAICSFDRRYTCSKECERSWDAKGKSNRNGVSAITEDGKRLWKAVADPQLAAHRESPDTSLKWGHNLIYGDKVEAIEHLKERDKFLETDVDDILSDFLDSDPDYFSVDSEEIE
jgi:hypothetical protein